MIAKLIGQVGSYRAINTDHDVSGPGQPVAIAQPPEESGDRIWVLDSVQYSYLPNAGLPIAGGLTVKLDDRIKVDLDLDRTSGSFNFYIPAQTDKTISVTLKSGGNGVVGKLNCQWHLEPAE
jgi:hypothetical protein